MISNFLGKIMGYCIIIGMVLAVLGGSIFVVFHSTKAYLKEQSPIDLLLIVIGSFCIMGISIVILKGIGL